MHVEKFYTVYILCSKRNGTLYIGITNNLIRRISEHKNKLIDGFTKKYKVNKLVYYECYESIADAISKEKKLKHYTRADKIELIESLILNGKIYIPKLFEDFYWILGLRYRLTKDDVAWVVVAWARMTLLVGGVLVRMMKVQTVILD